MRKDNPIFQFGTLFAIIASVVWIAYDILMNLANLDVATSNLVNNGFLVVLILLFFVTGIFAARKTSDFETGAYAGLFASFISALVGAFTLFALTFLFMDTIRQNGIMIQAFQNSGESDMAGFIIEDAIGGVLFGVPLSLALGGGMGAIGGLLGKRLAPRR